MPLLDLRKYELHKYLFFVSAQLQVFRDSNEIANLTRFLFCYLSLVLFAYHPSCYVYLKIYFCILSPKT